MVVCMCVCILPDMLTNLHYLHYSIIFSLILDVGIQGTVKMVWYSFIIFIYAHSTAIREQPQKQSEAPCHEFYEMIPRLLLSVHPTRTIAEFTICVEYG